MPMEVTTQTATVDWLSRSQAIQFLGISDAQYRADIQLLRELGVINHQARTKGISYQNYLTLVAFRQLAGERGKYEAAKALLQKQKSA